ncbi:hypothetical protein [Vibrio sp. WXL210]|uniref:hypothetical protein n=1 Tax=Vibrio sp. WXL210 TaxID=3450709 RepID=UPI003EC51CE8
MNPNTHKQIMTVMAAYNKKHIPYRRKQVMRLLSIFDDIFMHEPNLGERLHAVGRRQIVGYWERSKHESAQVRKEKYSILRYFYVTAGLSVRVPYPRVEPTQVVQKKSRT